MHQVIIRAWVNFALISIVYLQSLMCFPEHGNTLEKVSKYYETLYKRLVSKDYGFAEFGEPCEPTSTTELEDFLDISHEIIKNQNEDGKFRQSLEEHLRPKLRTFFYRSNAFCDYRKFLICAKQHKHCVCPHSSMGIGRNGSCQVNLGKRCDFTEQQLTDLGILVLSSETINVTCIGEAVCTPSFGASTKICKCKNGYWGSGCKSSASNYYSSTGGRGRGFLAEHPLGRSFWESSGDKSAEYFLYPEEIQAELVKMMNFREMFEPGEREKEAQELYNKMDSDSDKEEMVIMNIFVRRASSLNYGETCDPKKQIILDNPPLAKEDSTWVNPNPEDIKKWQTSLLKDGQPLCNFVNYLRCDDNIKVCQCKYGLSLENGKCHANVGNPCGSDYDGAFEFDPLRDRKRFSSPYSPICISGAICETKPLFFTKQCWCQSGKTCETSSNSSINTSHPPDLASDVNSRFTLNLGDACDPYAHRILLNPSDLDRTDYKQRIGSIKNLLGKKPELKFCILDNYYNCSESLKKCECWNNMAEEGGQCRVKNLDSCGESFVYGSEFYPTSSKMWKIEEVFQKKFKPQCIKNAKCGGASDENPGKCSCKNGKAGEFCDNLKSVFASVLKTENVQGFNSDMEINKVFYSLNYYTNKVEELMTLKYNDKCDPAAGLMLSRIVKFYQQVGSTDENISNELTLHQYSKTAKWTKYLLRTGTTELCNGFLGLNCHQTSEKCHCPKGYVYEDKICKLNVNEECDQKPGASWIPSCRNNSECTPALYNFKFACHCKKGWTGEACLDKTNKTEGDTDIFIPPVCPLGTECDSSEEEATTLDPNDKGKDKGTAKPEDDEDLFDEILELLKEIMNHRKLSLDSNCEIDHEMLLTNLFPHLPRFERSHYEHLPQRPRLTYSKLRRIYNMGYVFCDRRKYYACEKAKCKCNDGHGLIREGKECRLKEFSFCGEIDTVFDKTLPLPLCTKGTKCTKGDYGIHRCMHIS